MNSPKTTPAERVFIFISAVLAGLIAWLLLGLCK